jgi:hypothetical protein
VGHGRRLNGEAVERVVFALVTQRTLRPGSKLAATDWVAKRVARPCPDHVDRRSGVPGDGLLLEALNEIAAEVFRSLTHLLNLDLILILVDITSTSWHFGIADDLADLQDTVDDDDGMTRPAQ